MNTKAEEGEYKGNTLFKVIEVEEDGETPKSDYPVISFGLKKARALVNHIDELKAFVEKHQ